MKRKKPSFNETYHGYRSFSDSGGCAVARLLELAPISAADVCRDAVRSELTSSRRVRATHDDSGDRRETGRRKRRGSGSSRKKVAVESPEPIVEREDSGLRRAAWKEPRTAERSPRPAAACRKILRVWSAAAELGWIRRTDREQRWIASRVSFQFHDGQPAAVRPHSAPTAAAAISDQQYSITNPGSTGMDGLGSLAGKSFSDYAAVTAWRRSCSLGTGAGSRVLIFPRRMLPRPASAPSPTTSRRFPPG